MGFRFSKRIKLAPGISLNVGKRGASVSVGPRGMKTTIGKRGVRHSVGIPGTGMRYETTSYKPGRKKKARASVSDETFAEPCPNQKESPSSAPVAMPPRKMNFWERLRFLFQG